MTHLEIEAFFEIIRSGSISAAAERLYVTQPALSRRIRTLEDELGYSLFVRRKGQRSVELTPRGEAFVPVAHRWLRVWQEALELGHLDSARTLSLSSVNSVSSYLLPPVLARLADGPDGIRINFRHQHSYEAYQSVADGLVDLALISDDIYHKSVETIPAFQEDMVLAANKSCCFPEQLHPSDLDPAQEIRLPWNPECDMWHDFWFPSLSRYRLQLDQMNLLEQVLAWDHTWAIVPESAAGRLQSLGYISIHRLQPPPPPRIIYYLRSGDKKKELAEQFLFALDAQLRCCPHIRSYLGTGPRGQT